MTVNLTMILIDLVGVLWILGGLCFWMLADTIQDSMRGNGETVTPWPIIALMVALWPLCMVLVIIRKIGLISLGIFRGGRWSAQVVQLVQWNRQLCVWCKRKIMDIVG